MQGYRSPAAEPAVHHCLASCERCRLLVRRKALNESQPTVGVCISAEKPHGLTETKLSAAASFDVVSSVERT